MIGTEFSRTKSKNTYSLSSKVGKTKIMEKRKNLSSPKNVTKIVKKEANSLSNSSTPVNKTHSANFKRQKFMIEKKAEPGMLFYPYWYENFSIVYKLLQQSTVDESTGKGKLLNFYIL